MSRRPLRFGRVSGHAPTDRTVANWRVVCSEAMLAWVLAIPPFRSGASTSARPTSRLRPDWNVPVDVLNERQLGSSRAPGDGGASWNTVPSMPIASELWLEPVTCAIWKISPAAILTKLEVRNSQASRLERHTTTADPDSPSGSTGMPVALFIDETRRAAPGARLQRDRDRLEAGDGASSCAAHPKPRTGAIGCATLSSCAASGMTRCTRANPRSRSLLVKSSAPGRASLRPLALPVLFARSWNARLTPLPVSRRPEHRHASAGSRATTIGRLFSAPVFDRYGCEETGLIATESKRTRVCI